MSLETKAGGGDEKTDGGGWKETLKIFIHALLLALIVRVFFYQPFNIPSSSMKSTLLIGDYLFVSKLSYGYSRYSFPFGYNLFGGRFLASAPKRGDVIVFKFPPDNSTDYIKRLIGLPGDTVQMRQGVLYINGTAVPKRFVDEFDTTECEPPRYNFCPAVRYKRYEETLPNGVKYKVLDRYTGGPLDNTSTFKVPAGHYFMMGDNRDNSSDSRVQDPSGVGYVPFDNLIGRADIIFFSATTDDPGFGLLRPWTWPGGIRFRRFFNIIR